MKHILKYTSILLPIASFASCVNNKEMKPNILFVIADDQSYPYASAYGNTMVSTPGFDAIAKQGALFTNAYVTSPGSSPSRASILTGLFPWQIEEAGTHASSFPTTYTCFPDILQNNGYLIGFTGKGWGPGNWEISGRSHNPAGIEYNEAKLTPKYNGLSKIDYTTNFKNFLKNRKKGQPFYFWFGALEPHRPYELDSWIKENKNIKQATIPGYLPNHDTVGGDLLDFAVEVEYYDSHLVQIINELKRIGEFDNTIIIVTADNGITFPRAKANCYDAGIHVPLAICWGNNIKKSQIIETLVSTIDIAPTILEATNLKPTHKLSGISIMNLLKNNSDNHVENAVFAGRERHTYSRHDNLGYPMRSVRWKNYLLIQNFHPERYPAGDPQAIVKKNTKNPELQGYFDIDGAPSKDFLILNKNDTEIKRYFDLSVARRPEFELFNLKNDPDCLLNLVENNSYSDVLVQMKIKLKDKLVETNDTRLGNNPDIWETYPRLEGKMREFKAP